ncbi:MAG TPA: ABC transporter ATP-binding protein [Thermomicrobiaceae bacterium]|nr:ABC transporter ATP-binding protein [Thermomicrobiaceae bacterium]
MQQSRGADPPGSSAAGAVAVEMHDVRKVFDHVVALDGIDLEIARGEIVGIIGPSGSGKTTTIRIILGYYAPTEGTVRVEGHDPNRFTRRDREAIGYLPQHFVLYPDLTVAQNLSFIAGAYGMGWIARRRAIPRLLAMMHLGDARDRLAENISGGMQRRLELASALVHDPRLIVLDEPTAGIDPVLRTELWGIFRDLRDRGRTLIVTTQYVTEAEYCDRVALIDAGRVVALGTPDELRKLAYGGERVHLTIPDLDRALTTALLELPFVRSGERVGAEDLDLAVESAREAIPLLTERVQTSGHTVTTVEEAREPFDAVFVRLVERQGARSADLVG